MTLKPYSEYRDSGLRWLGAIPAHWDLVRTKHLFSERAEKGFPDEPLLAATQTRGVVPKEQYENRTVVAMKDLHLLKLVEKGDYVISLRSFQGGIEYTHGRGIISPAYTILKSSIKAKPDFFRFFFKSRSFVDALTLFVTGIRQGQNIDYSRLTREPLPVPPEEEQLKIGRFLRHFLEKINQLIGAKQGLIKLLNEQKQAIIHRAVTRGLDPNVPLRPSGVDWLGPISDGWTTLTFKRACTLIRDGTHLPPPRVESGVRLLSVRNIIDGKFVTRPDDSCISLKDYELLVRSFDVRRNDVLMAIVGATLGKVAVVQDMPAFHIQRSLAVLRPKPQILDYRFLSYFLQSSGFQRALWQTVAFSAQPGIYLGTIMNFRLALPPLGEQKQVVSFLERSLSSIEASVDRTRHELVLLREYRTRLISDVVTGKFDVLGVELKEIDDVEEFETFDAGDDIAAEALVEPEELAYADD